MSDSITDALIQFVPQLLPEVILGLMACVLFLGGTFKPSRYVWGWTALVALGVAAWALYYVVRSVANVEAALPAPTPEQLTDPHSPLRAAVYAAPVRLTGLAVFFKMVALAAAALFVLFSWNEPGDDQAAEYHGCLLLMTAGVCLTASANDLITLFLALELVSIPTYVMLYLPRADSAAQEAALKYFLLSIFSSALLLFGFSYLYGMTGTTNIPAILDALTQAQEELRRGEASTRAAPWQGLALVALVMVVAGLGFRITAVPFHFYAPDVYQGTTTGMAALLAFFPKVVGFAAMVRLLGFVPWSPEGPAATPGLALGTQVPVLLWIMAAVTMSLGNVLALLQDNLRRMLAYSSVAHAGYMLIGLAVAPQLRDGAGALVGGVEAVLFYLVAYGAMTVGAFAVLHHLGSERRVETVDDLAGLGQTHPGTALVMVLFLFSLIGLPLTAGFLGKFYLIFDALGLSPTAQPPDQVRVYRILAFIAVINAAVGSWYYLRIAAAMYLREAIEPLPAPRRSPVLVVIGVCAVLTLALGVRPDPLTDTIRLLLDTRPAEAKKAAAEPPPGVAQR